MRARQDRHDRDQGIVRLRRQLYTTVGLTFRTTPYELAPA